MKKFDSANFFHFFSYLSAMKRILTTLSVALALLTSTQAYAQQHILIEAEQFASCGGWSLDQQFIPQMGSSYLLAHGSGVPVEDAVTTVKVPKTGIWYAYVRTYNWTSPFCPGEGPGRCIHHHGSELPGYLLHAGRTGESGAVTA